MKFIVECINFIENIAWHLFQHDEVLEMVVPIYCSLTQQQQQLQHKKYNILTVVVYKI